MNTELRNKLISERSAKIVVGCKVRYAGNFLHDTGQFTGEVPQIVGTVVAIQPIGSTGRLVEFHDKSERIFKVLDCNLVCADAVDMSADW